MKKTWLDVLHVPNKTPVAEIIAYIETAAKEQLGFLAAGEHYSTTELATAMWHHDDIFPDNPGIDPFLVRPRLFKFLLYVDRKTQRPTILPQWRRRGPERPAHFPGAKDARVRPWEWFNPLAKGEIHGSKPK